MLILYFKKSELNLNVAVIKKTYKEKIKNSLTKSNGDFPGGQKIRTLLTVQRHEVLHLVQEDLTCCAAVRSMG